MDQEIGKAHDAEADLSGECRGHDGLQGKVRAVQDIVKNRSWNGAVQSIIDHRFPCMV